MKNKTIYIVLCRGGRKSEQEWLPTTTDETRGLYFASNRKGTYDSPVGFEKRQDAVNAIRRTKHYFKKYRFGDKHKIVPIKLITP